MHLNLSLARNDFSAQTPGGDEILYFRRKELYNRDRIQRKWRRIFRGLPYYSPLLCPYGNQCSNRRRESLDRAAAMFSELPHPSLPLSGDLSILFLMFMFPTYASPHINHS